MVLEPILTLSPDREQALSAGAYSSASHRFCGAASTALRQSEVLTGLPRTPVIPILAEDGEPFMPKRRRAKRRILALFAGAFLSLLLLQGSGPEYFYLPLSDQAPRHKPGPVLGGFR